MRDRSWTKAALGAALALTTAGLAVAAHAAERVTVKSAKPGSSYYVMSVQLGEALVQGSGGAIEPTVEDSQGSVQNVKEAAKRPGSFVFTAPPSLVKAAMAGRKPFEEADPAYKEIRGLFPIPYLTMHWVVRADSGITGFSGLAGQSFIPGGKGSFGYRKTIDVLEKLGVADKVDLVDVELDAAGPAVKNGQVAGMATAGSHPAPNVQELAATTEIRLLPLEGADLEKVGGDTVVIPAGTYAGVDTDTRTLTLPVGAYATTRMPDDVAYAVTRAYWEKKAAMGDQNPWWQGVEPAMIASLGAPLHAGALRYYEEAGIAVPDALK